MKFSFELIDMIYEIQKYLNILLLILIILVLVHFILYKRF